MKRVAISGGFDFLHAGHVRLIHDAALYGEVVVILNTDEWLIRKKGYKVMDWLSRAYILRAVTGVTQVIPADDGDDTVCKTLESVRPDYFANGGDRTSENTPEIELCNDLGIKLLFNIGGEKIASSSELVRSVINVA